MLSAVLYEYFRFVEDEVVVAPEDLLDLLLSLEPEMLSKQPPGDLLELLFGLEPEMLQNGLLETSWSYF